MLPPRSCWNSKIRRVRPIRVGRSLDLASRQSAAKLQCPHPRAPAKEFGSRGNYRRRRAAKFVVAEYVFKNGMGSLGHGCEYTGSALARTPQLQTRIKTFSLGWGRW